MVSVSVISGPIAVIDVETTGLFPHRHDRIIEVAAVVVQFDGGIQREFASLVNPARDIGPSRIHGLTAADVLHAPQFGEIAASLVKALDGTVALAGHNVRFDRQFLESEFQRLGVTFPECPSLCTMQLGHGGNLANCCGSYGISLEGQPHHALADARATAQLLLRILAEQPQILRSLSALPPIPWSRFPSSGKSPITRDESRRFQSQSPTFLQRLLGKMQNSGSVFADDGAVLAYIDILDRALEDRQIDDTEADALVELAVKWGLSRQQVSHVHRQYLERLAFAALNDNVLSDMERRDLELVARLLGQDAMGLDEILTETKGRLTESTRQLTVPQKTENSLTGKVVCFTGEAICKYRGQMITREMAMELATKAGLEVVDSLTKKVDVLVVADPYTQSGKAKKARQYGIRIMHEPVFWKTIWVDVQ